MSHTHGVDNEKSTNLHGMHGAGTQVAKDEGLYGAGHLLRDSFLET